MHNNSTICFKICTICIVILRTKKATTFQLLLFLTGDEGIEPPPKVLETPIIPFDQSPKLQKRHKPFSCTFKTTHKYLYHFIFFVPITLLGYALDLLVTVSYVHYCTSTSVQSTSSSSRGLTTYVGISHLEGGFTLRCLQRLSRPGLATLPCSW